MIVVNGSGGRRGNWSAKHGEKKNNILATTVKSNSNNNTLANTDGIGSSREDGSDDDADHDENDENDQSAGVNTSQSKPIIGQEGASWDVNNNSNNSNDNIFRPNIENEWTNLS